MFYDCVLLIFFDIDECAKLLLLPNLHLNQWRFRQRRAVLDIYSAQPVHLLAQISASCTLSYGQVVIRTIVTVQRAH